MPSFYNLMGVSSSGFDPEHRFVTSWLLPPTALASMRLLFSIYCFATTFTGWGWEGTHNNAQAIGREFSYFTHLTYWGITFYLLIASIHGFVYVRHGQSWLDRWPRPLQALHSLYYTTIVTLPFLVTIVYWVLLFDGVWFTDLFDAWFNVSKHGLNSLFALLELTLTSTNPPPFLHLPFLILILAMYLGLAYLTQHLQGWYTYSFLDPQGGQRSGRVAAYVFGILAAAIVVFLMVWTLIWLRKKITGGRVKRSKRDSGSRYLYSYARTGDVEMSMK